MKLIISFEKDPIFSLKYKGPERNTVGDKLELGTRFDLKLKISDIGINFWISLASKRHCRYIIFVTRTD